ncbi:hypothetical protein Tco_0971337 [Tanacetum coccineum]
MKSHESKGRDGSFKSTNMLHLSESPPPLQPIGINPTKGLQYINYWKEHASVQSKEIQQIEQEFLESCALDYYEHKDPKSMMKFVTAFFSMESKRVFLRSVGCLDDLLLLEEE